jgi:SAM-dependent methyltransferase
MDYSINRTEDYHEHSIKTLGWELTICNAMQEENTPIRKILVKNENYGKHLINFIAKYISLERVRNILEVGGGYGFIMREILQALHVNKAVMIDISKFLLDIQKKNCSNYNVEFIHDDIFNLNLDYFKQFDLIILNENLGDFPTIENIDISMVMNEDKLMDSFYQRMRYFIDEYELSIEERKRNNFNIGAVDIIERLCKSGVEFIYAGEHSCEAGIKIESSNKVEYTYSIPEKIKLAGHNEYTIKFSYLTKIAEKNNYSVKRGIYADFIDIMQTDELNFIMKSNSIKDEHEIVRHFIEDLYKYEYVLLIRN